MTMVATENVFVLSTELATLDLLKMKIFQDKGYYVIISVNEATNKVLSHNLNYTVDVVM